ncbi:hypothetical protein Tco_0885881, partial [Tanacetum coccineum]
MAEQNVPTQPPTRTDEQIVPRSQWLTIGKSNLLFNAQKIQKNPIFQISVDILSNTNFFQAFTASANVPAIYLQQFWNTMKYNEKTGVYSCQVDEQWFDLSVDLLRKALAITPVIPAHPFELPPSGNTVIDFVNELGYPEPVEIVSNIRVNYVYQPWRAILSLINQCLTGKTSGSDKPRHPVLQMLWGIVTQTNVDHAELIWEEFTQGIQTFFSHKASHNASLKNPKKKVTPLLIPYGRFSKVIIYYLASNNNIHRRPGSAVHHTGDDYVLGNLKFVPKGESVEVFGMAIPDPLITEAIQQSSYYPKYLEMVAKNTKKTPQESASVQSATKRATPKKPTTTTPVKQSKPAPPPTKKPSKHDEAQQESIPHEEGNDPDLERAKKMSLEALQEQREGEGDDADLERAIKLSLDPAFLPQGRAPVGGVTIRDPVSETTSKLHEVVGKGKAVVTEEQVAHSLIDLSKKKRTTDQFILKETESETELLLLKVTKDQDDVTRHITSEKAFHNRHPEKAQEALAGPDTPPQVLKKRQSPDPSRRPDWIRLREITFPTAVDKYLGTKLDDALLKILERHTADLIEKYSVLPGPESVKNQESERVFRRLSEAKKHKVGETKIQYLLHQAKDKFMILKNMIIKNKDAMEMKFSGKVKDHKRKHDSDDDEDDDDDEGPSAGSNQITDTRDADVDSSMHGSDPESEHSEQSSENIPMQDEGNESDMEDTDNAHIPKVSTTTWYKPIPESERLATPEPEWTIPSNDF